MCESHSLFLPSMTAEATTKAARVPSGETRTSVTRLTRIAISGVQVATSFAWAGAASRTSAARRAEGRMEFSFRVAGV